MSEFRFQFAIGEPVYSVMGEHNGFVTGITLRQDAISYAVTWGHDLTERWHCAFELSKEQTFSNSTEATTL